MVSVADRVWRAFWKDDGHPLEVLTGLVQESLGEGPIPTCFVAHRGEQLLGTVSVIACDEETRPQYTPWVAALWVEPEHRRQGIGATLVEQAVALAFAAGAERAYLIANSKRRAFYEKLAWSVLEENVPKGGMFVLSKARPGLSEVVGPKPPAP